MTIVCGTDFSASATGALRVAALLSRTLGEPLMLVHVLDELGAELTLGERSAVYNPIRTRLRGAARQARELGADVHEDLVPGNTAGVLATLAARANARLVVVSSLGRRAPVRWLLGSVAERLARACSVPVLIVRDSAPFEHWLGGEGPLAVMVGADLSESSDAALRWVEDLRRVGPCDVTVAHVAWPPGEHDRLGVQAPIDAERLHPDIERTILRDLKARLGELAGEGEVRFLVRQGFGRADEHLVSLAEEARADLLVAGSHQRSRVDRLWHGSVSRGVVHLAPMSVATIPRPNQLARETRTIPTVEQILVATDFSDTGDRAVVHALSLLPNGGTMHLVHVLTPALDKTPVTELMTARRRSPEEWGLAVQEIHDRLEQLVPEEASSRGVRVVADVLEGFVVDEVCRAAERLGVDAICVGSRGRSALTAALLGSVAQGVIGKSRRPVLVVPPRER
jgi:nucleotide-binding universal stress UspA family protein